METELLKVEMEDHWQAYHSIRQHVLYELRGLVGYDEGYPDEHRESNTPLLFFRNGEPVGTVRLDREEHGGIVRLVAILPEHQRQGMGTAMLNALEKLAAREGIRKLEVHAARDAVQFYEKLGWAVVDPTRDNPLMMKYLP